MWFNVEFRVEGTSDSEQTREQIFAAIKSEIFESVITLDDGTDVCITHFQPNDL